jgi:hypothetical protein
VVGFNLFQKIIRNATLRFDTNATGRCVGARIISIVSINLGGA